MPVRVGGTRWVPHMLKGIDVFFHSYNTFVTHLDNSSHTVAKAEGLSKLAQDINVVAYLVILKVINFPFNKIKKQ